MVTQTINLNLIPGTVAPRIWATQNDTGLRAFTFNLFAGADPYDVDSGYTVMLVGTKPDHTTFAYECDVDDNTATADCSAQMTALVGNVLCAVKVVDGENNVAASANFVLVVEVDPQALAEVSENDLASLATLTAEAAGYAAAAASAAESVEASAAQIQTNADNIATLDTTVDGIQTDVGNLQTAVGDLQTAVGALQTTTTPQDGSSAVTAGSDKVTIGTIYSYKFCGMVFLGGTITTSEQLTSSAELLTNCFGATGTTSFMMLSDASTPVPARANVRSSGKVYFSATTPAGTYQFNCIYKVA